MKRTVIITVVSEDGKLSCSEKFEYDASAVNVFLEMPVELALVGAIAKLDVLEAKGPWKKAPEPTGK